jgi:hypothetical protein
MSLKCQLGKAVMRRMMREAYRELASIEPRLERIERAVRAGEHLRDADDQAALGSAIEQQLGEVFAGTAASEDELMRTMLAGSLARCRDQARRRQRSDIGGRTRALNAREHGNVDAAYRLA